jgi:hypothetical protein
MDEERHLIAQLSQGDHIVQKTLQWLDGELRKGRFFADPSRVRTAVRHSIHRSSVKVKRWALNVLSQLGLARDMGILDDVFHLAESDPDILASIVRLVFREAKANAAKKLLETKGIAMEGIVLIAASEHSLEHRKRLVTERIPLDGGSAAELRSAIVLAGKAQAPPNLFLANHSNDIALSELNRHEHPSVVKYSIWALAELRLGFGSLKLDISNFDASPPEVRKWIIRLLFSDEIALRQNIDLIRHTEMDVSEEVREEAALELRNTYLEEACEPILHWFHNEMHVLTRMALLDHIATYSERNIQYAHIVKSMYNDAAMKSPMRTRIEACVVKTSMYAKLRTIEMAEESSSLFANDNDYGANRMIINQTFNNSTIGAVSGTGDVNIQTQDLISGIGDEMLKSIFEKILTFIQEQPEGDFKKQGSELLKEAAAAPSKPLLNRIVDWLRLAKDGITAGSALAATADGLVHQLNDYAGLM